MQLLLSVFIVICVLLLLSAMTKSKLMDFVARGFIGSVMIVVMNCLLPQYVIGLSFYTVGFTAILGMPGLMTLYIFRMIV